MCAFSPTISRVEVYKRTARNDNFSDAGFSVCVITVEDKSIFFACNVILLLNRIETAFDFGSAFIYIYGVNVADKRTAFNGYGCAVLNVNCKAVVFFCSKLTVSVNGNFCVCPASGNQRPRTGRFVPQIGGVGNGFAFHIEFGFFFRNDSIFDEYIVCKFDVAALFHFLLERSIIGSGIVFVRYCGVALNGFDQQRNIAFSCLKSCARRKLYRACEGHWGRTGLKFFPSGYCPVGIFADFHFKLAEQTVVVRVGNTHSVLNGYVASIGNRNRKFHFIARSDIVENNGISFLGCGTAVGESTVCRGGFQNVVGSSGYIYARIGRKIADFRGYFNSTAGNCNVDFGFACKDCKRCARYKAYAKCNAKHRAQKSLAFK